MAKTAAAKAGSGEPEMNEQLERLLFEARAAIQDLRLAASLMRVASDGTGSIFYRDSVVHAALPWADVDHFQSRLLSRRTPEDELILTQLIDLIPSLAGRTLVDVGSFTGTTAFILRAFLAPDATHLFEPQAVMAEALQAAIEKNAKTGGPITLHRDILDEEGQEIEIGANTPVRLWQTRYLRREGGALKARALDSFDLGTVGLINVDFVNDKVPFLRGAMQTIERDRPVIVVDLSARDIDEVRAELSPRDYQDVRAGRNSMIFLPS